MNHEKISAIIQGKSTHSQDMQTDRSNSSKTKCASSTAKFVMWKSGISRKFYKETRCRSPEDLENGIVEAIVCTRAHLW